MNIDYQQKITEITNWLRETVKNAGFSHVVVAVSGGVDSAVSISLAVKALGKDNVYAVMLPYGSLSKKGLEHTTILLDKLELPKNHRHLFDIQATVDEILWNETRNKNE